VRNQVPASNTHGSITFRRFVTLMALSLIIRVTIGVLLNYRDYFPPNFESEFLRGRQDYFFGSYQWAFYAHLVSGPVTLILGLVLISDQFRLKFRNWHRRLGRFQCLCILFVVSPTGLWMALHVDSGPVSAIGFATLAILTAFFVMMGWRAAVKRRFVSHRKWMLRCFLLLCSAVVLRLVAGFVSLIHYEREWIYLASAWVSWLVPLLVFEIWQWRRDSKHTS